MEECYGQEERQEEEGICYLPAQRRKHKKYVDMRVEGKTSTGSELLCIIFTGN